MGKSCMPHFLPVSQFHSCATYVSQVGTPSGEAGSTLPGIDLGIRGMRVGGLRRLLVPPELAYGDKGVGGEGVMPVDIPWWLASCC
jgi:hypothetical protein